MQAKVRTYVAQKRCSTQDATQQDMKSITVPISTFPPTAMVYNITKPTVDKHSDDDSDDEKPAMDIVSAAIMAKVLEDREKERIFAKHCDTCTCHRSILMVDAETQTCVPNAPSFSQGHTYNIDKQTLENILNNEMHQSKDKLQPSLATHAILYEINENSDKVRHQMNGDCSKYASQSIKDKFVSRCDRNTQDNMTEENCATTKTSLNKKNSSHDSKRSPSFSKLNDLNRINIDKASKNQLRANNNKNCDSSDNRFTTRCWNKSEKNSFPGPGSVDSDNRLSDKEQTHIDIINDRLWKNEWTKMRSETIVMRENKCKTNRNIELDIINDRDWKNDRLTARNATQFTLIEVKSSDNSAANHNDGSQTEATSPSFSSDSMVISSSDPSSSCSDVAQSLTGGAFNSSAKSNLNQIRVTGPRNCLMRVTPGSKNILLDNAGHYKAVVYSNGSSGKANTALVHAKKGSRAGSERSISTSSEDNLPLVLLQDNHLQRVAEWVQSSMCMEDPTQFNSNKIKCMENIINDNSSSVYPTDPLTKSSEQDILIRDFRDASKKSSKTAEECSKNCVNNKLSNIKSLPDCTEHDESENLITFEVPEKHLSKDSRKKDLDYEVKITKEMEETYLKLAASLDPVAFSLSSTSDAELTIEKYRKDHKKLHVQRIQDKAGSKT